MAANELLRAGIQLWLESFIKRTDVVGDVETAQVASSCLSEVSYDHTTETLTVTFVNSGNTYEYFSVPESEFESLITSIGSIGESYNDSIKGNYAYAQV